MVLENKHVEAQGKLWGEMQFDIKPPLATPTFTWSHDIIAQGHINKI
jgi:hypothetical protein